MDWDILNEDFANINAWTDLSTSGGVPSAVTFDGKSCLKLDFPTDATADPSLAVVKYTAGLGIPTTCTIEIKLYHALDESFLGAYVREKDGTHDFNAFRMGRSQADGGGNRHSGLALHDGTSYVRQLTGQEGAYLNCWIVYRFVIKAGPLVDMWGNNVPYCFGFTSADTSGNNELHIFTAANTGERSTLYVDYIKIDTTPEGIGTSPLQIGDEDIVCSYAHDGTASTSSSNDSKLRAYNKDIGNNACVCSVPLVATTDSLASKVRVYNGAATQSLKKVPA